MFNATPPGMARAGLQTRSDAWEGMNDGNKGAAGWVGPRGPDRARLEFRITGAFSPPLLLSKKQAVGLARRRLMEAVVLHGEQVLIDGRTLA
jgi:hypothetical protein